MLLLAKITAVTIGMVLTLNGAERPLPQEGRMQEGMRKQESCEVVPVMKKEQKIARTARNSYDIMEQGAYGFRPVDDRTRAGRHSLGNLVFGI